MAWELDIYGLTTWHFDKLYRQGVHITDDLEVAQAASRVLQGITVRELGAEAADSEQDFDSTDEAVDQNPPKKTRYRGPGRPTSDDEE